MEKTEKIFCAALTVAAIGVVVFWVTGYNGNQVVSSISFVVAGIAAYVALGALVVHKLRNRYLH